MPKAESLQGDDLERAVDQTIAACDGDTRAALRALVVANGFLYAEAERWRRYARAASRVVS